MLFLEFPSIDLSSPFWKIGAQELNLKEDNTDQNGLQVTGTLLFSKKSDHFFLTNRNGSNLETAP
jgi:hypothetical protein